MLKHLLPALAAAQALGIVLATTGAARLDLAIALGALAVVHGCFWPGARSRAALALLLAGAAGSVAVGMAALRSGPELAAPWEGVVEGTVGVVSFPGDRWRVDFENLAAVTGPAGLPRIVRLRGEQASAGAAAFERLPPGSRVRAQVRLRPPGGLRNPGGRDPAAARRRSGVAAVGRLGDPALFARLPARDSRIARTGLHGLRARLGERLAASGPGGALLRALALGDRGGLEEDDRAAFAVLGLAHLLAVSGLHLGLVAAGSFAGLRRVAARVSWLPARLDVRGVALAGAALAALGFALLAGWGVPVRRALVLLLGLVASFAARRPLPPLGPLALAAIWILATDPLALFAPGAQLSFVATVALGLGFRAGGVRRRRRAWVEGLRASATALAVTAPLAALHWGTQAPFALLANAVAVPWTAFVLLPAALASALCASLQEGAIASLVVAAGERTAAFSLAAAQAAAAWAPGVSAGPPAAGPWLLGAGLLGLLAIRLDATVAKAGVALAVAGVLALAPASTILPRAPRLVAFDVSQGDAVLVQGRDAAILVDAGSALPSFDLGRQAVVPALRALGVAQLDLVVASHGDLDHRGGLVAVVEALPVMEVWLPPGGLRDPVFAALRQVAAARGSELREQSAGSDPWRVGDVAVEVLWPPAGSSALARNDRSLVLRVEVAGRAVLLPGDIESDGEQALLASGVPLAAEILKLPHHGSRSSSSSAFLRAVAPRVAIASAPCRGRWAMPHAEVRARLRRLGASLWWTGRDGAVRVGLGRRFHVVGTGRARQCDPPASAR